MGADNKSHRNAQLGKRRVSEISSCPNSPPISGDSSDKPSSFSRVFDEEFLKQFSEAVDKLKYECCGVPNCPNYVPETPMSPLEGGIESACEVKGSDSNEVFYKKVRFLVENLKRQPCGSVNCPNTKTASDKADSSNVVDVVGDNRSGRSDFVEDDEVKEDCGSALDGVARDEGERCGSHKRAKIARDKADSSNVVNVVGDPQSGQSDSVDDEVKEDCGSALDRVDPDEGQRCGSLEQVKISHDVDSNNEVTEPCDSALGGSVDQDKGQVLPNGVVVGEISVKDDVVSNLVLEEEPKTCERSCLEDEMACRSENTKARSNMLENDESNICDLTVEDVKIDGRCESIVSSGMPKPVDGKPYPLVKCTALNAEGSYSCSDAGLDLLKSCSCSFCTKAGYIWSDLHYKDVQGRMSILMKSQREANNLAQRISCDNASGSHQLGDFSEATRLEIDLKNQWKSLFLNMEDVFVDESNQLQTNFLALKDLRDGFKTNLESINGITSYVQTSSDTSDHRII